MDPQEEGQHQQQQQQDQADHQQHQCQERTDSPREDRPAAEEKPIPLPEGPNENKSADREGNFDSAGDAMSGSEEKAKDDSEESKTETKVESHIDGEEKLVEQDAQEVTSTSSLGTKEKAPGRGVSSKRRASYQASRYHMPSFQNYGLAYLPYKSNFEPSEDARRRADEFVKTLKL